jgi:hypothetical protein
MSPPAGGVPVAIDALRPALQFCTPKQLGPTTRTPPAWAASTAARWSAAPSGPASANPPEITIAAPAPAAAASAMTPGTAAAGTTRTARSTPPGMSWRRR